MEKLGFQKYVKHFIFQSCGVGKKSTSVHFLIFFIFYLYLYYERSHIYHSTSPVEKLILRSSRIRGSGNMSFQNMEKKDRRISGSSTLS